MPHDFEETVRFGCALLQAAGLPAARARRIAQAQTAIEGFGIPTHGLHVLASCARALMDGNLPPDGECSTRHAFGAVTVLDGSRVPGPEALIEARDRAVASARACGIGMASVTGTGWVGALGYHLAARARENFLLLAWAQMSAYPCVVPYGGRDGRLSTNPMALVIPDEPDPAVLDFSTAIVASGKVYQWEGEGRRAPEPMFYDGEGRLSDDPHVFRQHQAMLPFGGASAGFRGTGLSVWIEALTAAAGGLAAGGGKGGQNAHVIAIHGDALGDPSAARAEWTRFRDYLLSSRPAADHPAGPQLAGASQWRSLARARAEGLVLAPDLVAKLADLAAELGVPPPGDAAAAERA